MTPCENCPIVQAKEAVDSLIDGNNSLIGAGFKANRAGTTTRALDQIQAFADRTYELHPCDGPQKKGLRFLFLGEVVCSGIQPISVAQESIDYEE